jgi:beta-lactamase regulating signal transducer with metallopeptidase domain
MELLTPSEGLIIWSVLPVASLVLMVIALMNVLRSDFKDSASKLIWVIVILFIPLVGSILYFSIGRKQRVVTQ